MVQKRIITLGDPLLRTICSPVENTADVLHILDVMTEILRTTPQGAAVAAPQVGSTRRLVVIRPRYHLPEFINPEIIKKSGHQKGPESCLSLPGMIGIVTRFRHVTVKALNRAGEEITIEAKGFLARCLQHEIDHLDGILFIDHVPPGKLYDQYTKAPLDAAYLIELSKQRIPE